MDVFPEGIPSNAFIDKSKTGLGLTYAEFHADRSSIIVVPTVSIIEDKASSYHYKQPFALYKGCKEDELAVYLKNSAIKYKKIITTPDSFGRLMEVVIAAEMLDEVYNDYFCFLDEIHCYAVERFRKHILRPFRWFWNFENKAVGSATPYEFSDKRFHAFDYFKLNFDEKFGTITLVEHDDTVEALAYLLSDLTKFMGNVHIFLNSVRLINRVINKVGLKDVHVYCADEDKNSDTLAENSQYLKKVPFDGIYAKVNFYSSRYFEGWDLVDNEQATFILVTDVNVEHSLASVQFKGFQSMGRLRSAKRKVDGRPEQIRPHAIYHITNTVPFLKRKTLQPLEAIKTNWFFEAESHIEYYNSFIQKSKEAGMSDKGIVGLLVERFADIEDGKAILSPMKVDQNICEEYYRQFYNSIELIKQAWEEMNYDVEIRTFPKDIDIAGEDKKTVNKRIIEILERTKQSTDYEELLTEAYFRKLKNTHADLFLSYHALGPAKLEELGYDDNLMMKERLKVSNKALCLKVKEELEEELDFVGGTKYARPQIKKLLQSKYNKYKVYGDRKKIKVARVNEFLNDMGIKFKPKGKVLYEDRSCPAIVFYKEDSLDT